MAAQWQTFLVLSLFFCNGDSQFGGFDFGGGGGGLNFDDINNAFNNLGSGGSLSDLKDSFDLSSLTSTALKNLQNLPKDLLKALSNPLKLSASALKSIPADILGSLSPALLGQFNSTTVSLLAPKLSKASTSVLTHFFQGISPSTLTASLSSLQNFAFNPSQLNGMAKSYKKAIGDLSKWTSKQFKDLGKLTKGLSSTDLSKISKNIFDDVIGDLTDGFSRAQAQGIFSSAKIAWGNVNTWSKDQLKRLDKLAVNLPVSSLWQLSSSVLTDVVDSWSNLPGWSPSQKGIMTEKLKNSWGKISAWPTANVKKIMNLVDGMSADDLSQLNSESLVMSGVLHESNGNLNLSPKQLAVIVSKLKKRWGSVQKWTREQSELAGRSLLALLPSDISTINISAIVDRYEDLAENCGFTPGKAGQIWNRVVKAVRSGNYTVAKTIPSGQVSDWTAKAFDNLQCLARGLVCGEFRNLTAGVVKAAKDITSISDWSKPQLAQLIKKFGPVVDLTDLEGLAHGISRGSIQNLGWTKLNFTQLPPGVFQKFGTSQLMALAEEALKRDVTVNPNEVFWGADTVGSYGRMLRGFSKTAIMDLPPAESFSDVLNAFSKVPDLTEEQIATLWNRFKHLSGITSASDLKNMSAIDVAEIGPIIISLKLDELSELTPEACNEAIVQMNQASANFQRWAGKTKLVAIAKWAVNCLKSLEPGLSVLSSDHVAKLGRLVEYLEKDSLDMISKEAVLSSIAAWGISKDLNEDGLKALAYVAKKYLKLDTLTVQDVAHLGSILKGFTSSDIAQIPAASVAKAVSEIGDLDSLSSDQVKAFIGKVKSAWGSNITAWSADNLLSLGDLVRGLTGSDIESIGENVFDDVVELLGKTDLTDEQIQAAIKVAKKVWGDLKAVSAKTLKPMGKLLRGLSVSELGEVIKNVFNCDGALYDLGQIKGWTPSQAKEVVKQAKAKYGEVSDWSGDVLNNLGSFLQGADASDLAKSTMSSVQEGLKTLGSLGLSTDQKRAILKRPPLPDDPSIWARSLINEAGNLLGGLNTGEVRTLGSDLIGAIDASTIPELGDDFIKSMTNYQLKNLGADQARAISAAQVSALEVEQCQTLQTTFGEEICAVPTQQPQPTSDASTIVTSFGSLLTAVVIALLVK
eukprot:m.17986 g.17986  ORF g.17986 m.17986 type:complete len:1142 (+) comp27576_c0_seq4:311-3736(+)